MGIFDNIFSSKKKKKSEKKLQSAMQQQSANQELFAAQMLKAGGEAPVRQQAAEQGKLEVTSLLGRPNSYQTPTFASTGAPPAATGISGGIFDPNKPPPASLVELLNNPNITPEQRAEIMSNYQGVLDPQKYAEAIGQTADFRIMSNLTAQYEQGINEMGPLWDQYKTSVTGPIIEGAAMAYAESRDLIMQNAAKGGTARRTAMTEAQNLQAQEASNRMKSQNLWQANLALKETMIKGAREQVQLNQDYVNNLPFQNTYNDTMNQLTEFISGSLIPKASMLSSAAEQNNVDYRKMKLENASKVSWLGKFVIGAGTSLAGSLVGGSMDGGLNAGSVNSMSNVYTNLFNSGNESTDWSIDRGTQQQSGFSIDRGQGNNSQYGIFGKED